VSAGYGSDRGGRFSDELLDEIRDKSDIVAVIGEYVALKRRGSNYVGLCPFHNEKTPSFTVSPDKQMFYCFGCQTGGNIYTFLMQREGLGFTEAVEHLAARAGVTLPERGRSGITPAERSAQEKQRRERDLLYRVVDFASRFYHRALLKEPEAEKARRYLARRGVKPESVKSFRLGYSPASWDSLVKALEAKGVSEEAAEKAGLALKSKEGGGYYDRFRGRLMFTICDRRGRPIGFGARALDDGDEPKYLNSPETPLFNKSRALYALDLASTSVRRGRTALVVEGYMDVIACHEFGFDFTVASMGTAFTSEQARLLRRLTDTVVTAFDADTAGAQATVRGLEVLRAAGFKVKVAETPGGKDPDECLRGGGGPAAFRDALERAVPLVEYRFRLAVGHSDTSTIEGKVRAVQEIVPVLATIESPVELAEYLRDFAGRLSLSEDSLRAELARYREAAVRESRRGGGRDRAKASRHNKAGLPDVGRPALSEGRDPVRAAERTLLGCMAASPEGLEITLNELAEAGRWFREIGLPAENEIAAAGELASVEDDAPAAPEGPDLVSDDEVSALEWFGNPACRRAAGVLCRAAKSGAGGTGGASGTGATGATGGTGATGDIDPAAVIDTLAGSSDPDAAQALSRAVFEAGLVRDDPEHTRRVIRDCLGVLKEHRLNSRIEDLYRRISDLERKEAELAGRTPEAEEELQEVRRILSELFRELIDLERHTDGGTGHWKVPGD